MRGKHVVTSEVESCIPIEDLVSYTQIMITAKLNMKMVKYLLFPLLKILWIGSVYLDILAQLLLLIVVVVLTFK